MSDMPKSEAYNMDCLAAMREMPDKAFDLAIVDPPYGLGQRTTSGGSLKNSQTRFIDELKSKKWDDVTPSPEYFYELFRVSVNQIIWGGNYFGLPAHRTFVVWDKMTYIQTMSQIEIAYTSFDSPARLVKINSNDTNRLHPTQKPIALYKWLLQNYAKQGDRILDTHLGSGSSRIAAYDMGFDFTGYELDTEYFDAMNKRFAAHISRPAMFAPEQMYQPKQSSMF
jgi:site-specific DNA-methyltransferase (adenine-specific)